MVGLIIFCEGQVFKNPHTYIIYKNIFIIWVYLFMKYAIICKIK